MCWRLLCDVGTRYRCGAKGHHLWLTETFLTRFSNGKLVIKMMSVSISFPKHNSATLRNILMVHSRIIEQVNADCRGKNENSAYLGFLITSPYPCLYFGSGLSLSKPFEIF